MIKLKKKLISESYLLLQYINFGGTNIRHPSRVKQEDYSVSCQNNIPMIRSYFQYVVSIQLSCYMIWNWQLLSKPWVMKLGISIRQTYRLESEEQRKVRCYNNLLPQKLVIKCCSLSSAYFLLSTSFCVSFTTVRRICPASHLNDARLVT